MSRSEVEYEGSYEFFLLVSKPPHGAPGLVAIDGQIPHYRTRAAAEAEAAHVMQDEPRHNVRVISDNTLQAALIAAWERSTTTKETEP